PLQSSRSFSSGSEQALLLTLLPIKRGQLRSREPGRYCGAQLGLTLESRSKGDVRELDVIAAAELAERPQLVQLQQAVEPVAATGSARNDEPCPLHVAEHPWRPARPGRCFADRQLVHRPTLTHMCQGRMRRCTSPIAAASAPAARRYSGTPP